MVFDTDTSVPVVDIQQDLDLLLHFDRPDLTWAAHYGRWMDYRTLVILFPECVQWTRTTSSGREKPLFVVFETQKGVCVCMTLYVCGMVTLCVLYVCMFVCMCVCVHVSVCEVVCDIRRK